MSTGENGGGVKPLAEASFDDPDGQAYSTESEPQLSDEDGPSFEAGDWQEQPPDFDPQDYLQALLGESGTEAPDLPPMSVRRYWLDEASFRAIAVLEQDGNAALVLSDGENQIVLFDSVSQDITGLYLLAQVVDEAIAVLDVPDLTQVVNEAMEEETDE